MTHKINVLAPCKTRNKSKVKKQLQNLIVECKKLCEEIEILKKNCEHCLKYWVHLITFVSQEKNKSF